MQQFNELHNLACLRTNGAKNCKHRQQKQLDDECTVEGNEAMGGAAQRMKNAKQE